MEKRLARNWLQEWRALGSGSSRLEFFSLLVFLMCLQLVPSGIVKASVHKHVDDNSNEHTHCLHSANSRASIRKGCHFCG